MHRIQLDDQLYQDVQRRAASAGFETIDEFVADVLKHELNEETEDLNYLFTPERLAHIDEGLAQIDAGLGIPMEQVREHFRQRYENERVSGSRYCRLPSRRPRNETSMKYGIGIRRHIASTTRGDTSTCFISRSTQSARTTLRENPSILVLTCAISALANAELGTGISRFTELTRMSSVSVVHVFHTAQDWQAKLAEEAPPSDLE